MYYPVIHLGLSKTMSRRRCPGQDSNQAHPKRRSEAAQREPSHSLPLCTLTRTWLRSSQPSYVEPAPSLADIKYEGMHPREPLFSVLRYTILRYRVQPGKGKENFQDILPFSHLDWMPKMRNIRVNDYTETFPNMGLL
jgi:hypothetical protein